MLQNALPPLSFSNAIIAAILFVILAQVPHLCVGQNGPYTIQTDEIKGTKSLLETANGKFVFKACTSIVGLEFDTNDPEYYLVVSGKTVQLYHTASKTSILKKNIINPVDCYEISDDTKPEKKIITFYTTSGRRTYLISSSQILFPLDQNAEVNDISSITNTSEYLEVWSTVDEDYDQTVINWNGEQIMGPGKYDVIEFDSVNNLFIIRKDRSYGAMDLSGKISIPFEYDRLECKDGFYIAQSKNRVGVITPTDTILPFQFIQVQNTKVCPITKVAYSIYLLNTSTLLLIHLKSL